MFLAYICFVFVCGNNFVPQSIPEIPPYSEILETTYYNPYAGNHNCDDDCTVTAMLVSVDSCINGEFDYGCVACPSQYLGRYLVFYGKQYRCVDTGGAIKQRFNRVTNTLHIKIDVMGQTNAVNGSYDYQVVKSFRWGRK